MPTRRPRHMITETDQIAQALDDAARTWPAEHHRGRLLQLLITEGHRALREQHERRAQVQRDAVTATSGVLTGVYGKDYLDQLREDWPA